MLAIIIFTPSGKLHRSLVFQKRPFRRLRYREYPLFRQRPRRSARWQLLSSRALLSLV